MLIHGRAAHLGDVRIGCWETRDQADGGAPVRLPLQLAIGHLDHSVGHLYERIVATATRLQIHHGAKWVMRIKYKSVCMLAVGIEALPPPGRRPPPS